MFSWYKSIPGKNNSVMLAEKTSHPPSAYLESAPPNPQSWPSYRTNLAVNEGRWTKVVWVEKVQPTNWVRCQSKDLDSKLRFLKLDRLDQQRNDFLVFHAYAKKWKKQKLWSESHQVVKCARGLILSWSREPDCLTNNTSQFLTLSNLQCCAITKSVSTPYVQWQTAVL